MNSQPASHLNQPDFFEFLDSIIFLLFTLIRVSECLGQITDRTISVTSQNVTQCANTLPFLHCLVNFTEGPVTPFGGNDGFLFRI